MEDILATLPTRKRRESHMSFPPPPFSTVWELATTYWLSRCLHVATEIGVADALGPEPARPDALASSVGVNADALFRIVRLLAAHGVFEVKDGRIAHTPRRRSFGRITRSRCTPSFA
jgi:hypothetical protein